MEKQLRHAVIYFFIFFNISLILNIWLAISTIKMKVFISLEPQVVFLGIFDCLNLKYLGWPYKEYIKTARMVVFFFFCLVKMTLRLF